MRLFHFLNFVQWIYWTLCTYILHDCDVYAYMTTTHFYQSDFFDDSKSTLSTSTTSTTFENGTPYSSSPNPISSDDSSMTTAIATTISPNNRTPQPSSKQTSEDTFVPMRPPINMPWDSISTQVCYISNDFVPFFMYYWINLLFLSFCIHKSLTLSLTNAHK